MQQPDGPKLVKVSGPSPPAARGTDAEVSAFLASHSATMLENAMRERRLYARATAHLPLDPAEAGREPADEERALRASRPRNRRWRALDKLDADVDRLQSEVQEARARLAAAEQALESAPSEDARTLADWIASGERGARPAPSVYERERETNAARILVDAVGLELDRALGRRADHVAKHRPGMLKDARKDLDEAERSFVSALRTLPELRQRMFDARATLLWAASFPEREPVWPGMSPDSVALGLMEPVRLALNIRTMLPFAGLVALLKEDAAAIAGAFSPEQKLLLGEPAPSGPDRRGALWSDSPEGIAYQAEQREHARRLAETGFHDAAQLAREVRD